MSRTPREMERVATPDNGQRPDGQTAAYHLLKHAADVLRERAEAWVVLLMSFALFGYASWQLVPLAFVSASTFTILWALMTAWRERR